MRNIGFVPAVFAIAFSGLSYAATPPVSFGLARDYAAGSGPAGCAVGDFNGDGIPDIAVADRNSKTVSILIGVGQGAYRAPVPYATGNEPWAVAVGDLNGDSKLDLVVVNLLDGTLSVLLGLGDGTFQPAVSYAIGYAPIAVVLEDMNGDGKLDVVATLGGGEGVAVLLGSGDGAFGPAMETLAGINPTGLAVADFNRDGRPDVGVGDSTNGVLVLLGNGDGTFQPPVAYGPPDTVSVNVGDANGDGIADLITLTNESEEKSQINVLLGNGDGTFQPALRTPENGSAPTLLVSGDFNGDQKLDIVIARPETASATLLLGDGTGNFTTAGAFPIEFGASVLAAADLNGDGKSDLIVTAEDADAISVLLGNGKGTLGHPDQITVTDRVVYLCGPAIADVNGDGKADLITSGTHLKALEVYLGNGDGTFGDSISSSRSSGCQALVAADMNGDGIQDVVVASIAATVDIELGNGYGTFRPAGSATLPQQALTVAVADLNGDGIPDVVTTEDLGGLSVFLGNGDGTLQAPQTYAVGADAYPTSVALADVNQDGHIDMVVGVVNEPGNKEYIAVFPGNGDGTFGTSSKVSTGSGYATESVVVEDFDGDGVPDIGALAENGHNFLFGFFRGLGGGNFASPVYTGLPFGVGAILAGDFNDDGKPDVAVLDADSQNLEILRNDGGGRFTLENAFWGLGLLAEQFAVGDLNGDGLPDVVSANESTLTILLNTSK